MWDLIVSVPDHCLSFYFVRLKSFVTNLIDNFDIDSNTIHVRMTVYSTLVGETIEKIYFLYNMMQLTRKRIKKIHASYTLEGTNLENVESIKYLGVTITSDLRWTTHVSNVCTKANRTLGCLRRNLYSCPQEVKEAAYKGLVRPVLDYGS